jgi:hypothetical protein
MVETWSRSGWDLAERWPTGSDAEIALSKRTEILTGVDPRKLERLLRLLTKYGVTRYDPSTGALELGPVRPAAPAEPTRPAPIDVRDPKSVDDFLRARLAPAGGSS